ncbi:MULTISPECIES: phage holin family protein [Providencia]|uniref:phage holin family protein n=1 Tax=Providencia TaxID=586 RepID=UPI001EF683E4|nr:MULTISPECIES: phage holin family protein [Providencia]EJD6581545.1 phage holin family protein [Providencia rettgeri]CAB5587633.1 Phage holin family 2 [Providencia rettgeri]CAC9124953.1 Phage holin family 2 [Providencia rettgeri]
MEEHEKTFIALFFMGVLIAIGKILTSDEQITVRLFFGRVILGAAISVLAGALLIWFPDISPLALTGIGTAFGIAGYQLVEMWLKKRGSALLQGKLKK